MRRRSAFLATIVALMLALSLQVSAVSATGSGVYADVVRLTGAAEFPGPGDPDASGFAIIVIVPEKDLVCWFINWRNVDGEPIFGHIHRAPAGASGPVVVPFQSPPGTESPRHGCIVDADADLVAANPTGHYVNIHSGSAFPGGAIRGQLD
jgi:hypothetical protein